MIAYCFATVLLLFMGAGHVCVRTANANSISSSKESASVSDRIVGGSRTTIQNYPYQVSIQYSGSHICGGSIISENYLITAGHCVVASTGRLSVRAGTSFFERGGTLHTVAKVTRHEKYQVNRYGVPSNDIAVMKIVNPFIFDDTRRPINLFEAHEQVLPGINGAITGWGRTSNFGNSPNQLQMVVVPIVEGSVCDRAYRSFGGLPGGQICAGFYDKGGKDACQGDSGGPLAIGGRLAGIVSWGNDCALAFFPGVYTEVGFFREWINKHAELS